MSEITAREKYCTVLMNLPLLYAEAIVVLAGEDWEPRIRVAKTFKLEHQGPQQVVISGGVEDPPRHRGAHTMNTFLLGAGVAPGHIIMDNESTNTREQAVNVIDLAIEHEWKSILLIASPYHCYRAHLTFLNRLLELDKHEAIRIQVAPTAHVPAAKVPWFEPPDGMDIKRLDLLGLEFAKIHDYAEHVATYEQGLEYLEFWQASDTA